MGGASCCLIGKTREESYKKHLCWAADWAQGMLGDLRTIDSVLRGSMAGFLETVSHDSVYGPAATAAVMSIRSIQCLLRQSYDIDGIVKDEGDIADRTYSNLTKTFERMRDIADGRETMECEDDEKGEVVYSVDPFSGLDEDEVKTIKTCIRTINNAIKRISAVFDKHDLIRTEQKGDKILSSKPIAKNLMLQHPLCYAKLKVVDLASGEECSFEDLDKIWKEVNAPKKLDNTPKQPEDDGNDSAPTPGLALGRL